MYLVCSVMWRVRILYRCSFFLLPCIVSYDTYEQVVVGTTYTSYEQTSSTGGGSDAAAVLQITAHLEVAQEGKRQGDEMKAVPEIIFETF